MKRILFFLIEKTGSTLLTAILLGKETRLNRGDLKNTKFPIWLKTEPEKQCQLYWHTDPNRHIITEIIPSNVNHQQAEAYTWEPPANLDSSFLNNFAQNDWKFVYLFRDPRNTMEGLIKRSTNVLKEEQANQLRKKMFKIQCEYANHRMASILNLQKDSRFFLLRSEEFIKDTLSQTESLFSFLGFNINRDFYQNVIDQQNSQINSSFGDKGKDSSRRWLSWTTEEAEIFDSIAGKNLIKMGYEKDNFWKGLLK